MSLTFQTPQFATGLIRALNERSAEGLLAFCHPSLRINSAVLGVDRRSNAKMHDQLSALIMAFESRFPGIRFRLEDDTGSQISVGSFRVSGCYRALQPSDRDVIVPCSCRVRLDEGKVREIWLSVDHYHVLRQLERILPEPSQAVVSAHYANQRAVDGLIREIVDRRTTTDALDTDVLFHARLDTYRDISSGSLETESMRLEGAGEANSFLSYLHRVFSDPVEASLSPAICQGHTSTYRGNIRGRLGGELHRYKMVVSMASSSGRVTDCWVTVVPPPTLMECLL